MKGLARNHGEYTNPRRHSKSAPPAHLESIIFRVGRVDVKCLAQGFNGQRAFGRLGLCGAYWGSHLHLDPLWHLWVRPVSAVTLRPAQGMCRFVSVGSRRFAACEQWSRSPAAIGDGRPGPCSHNGERIGHRCVSLVVSGSHIACVPCIGDIDVIFLDVSR
jgi:hypothetical protein